MSAPWTSSSCGSGLGLFVRDRRRSCWPCWSSCSAARPAAVHRARTSTPSSFDDAPGVHRRHARPPLRRQDRRGHQGRAGRRDRRRCRSRSPSTEVHHPGHRRGRSIIQDFLSRDTTIDLVTREPAPVTPPPAGRPANRGRTSARPARSSCRPTSSRPANRRSARTRRARRRQRGRRLPFRRKGRRRTAAARLDHPAAGRRPTRGRPRPGRRASCRPSSRRSTPSGGSAERLGTGRPAARDRCPRVRRPRPGDPRGGPRGPADQRRDSACWSATSAASAPSCGGPTTSCRSRSATSAPPPSGSTSSSRPTRTSWSGRWTRRPTCCSGSATC